MNDIQKYFLFTYLLFSFCGFVKALYECKARKNAFGSHVIFNLNGAFVWGDEVVFGLFWTIVSIVVLVTNNWLLFLLLQSMFWLVRSIGETIYWFLVQFSSKEKEPLEKFWIHKIFHNESIYFVFQIGWQCATVITAISTLYLSSLFLQSI